MLSVLGFCVSWGSISIILRVFFVLLMSGFRFVGLLRPRIAQGSRRNLGNLGYGNLVVYEGEMLPIFVWSSVLTFLPPCFALVGVSLGINVGITEEQLTQQSHLRSWGCFFFL